MRPKAYSYLRFSTPEQMKGDSFRRQTKLAREYADRHGLDLDTETTFRDLGVSAYQGRNREAGELKLFLEAVDRGMITEGSYLLVESLDRISRESARKAARTLEDICDLGIIVVTLFDGRKYSKESLDKDPFAFLSAILIFMRANEESAMKARRLRSVWTGKREKLAKGEKIRLTSRCPYWLRPVDGSEAGFEVIPERGEIVRRIFTMTLDGEGTGNIAKTLNSENVPVFGRGKLWHTSYVKKILCNHAVYGVLVPFSSKPNKKADRVALDPIEDYYPPVVSKEVFERVQRLKQSRTPLRGRHAKHEVQNVLGGFAVCPSCGSRVTRICKNTSKDWIYLACSAAKVGAGCEYRTVRYSRVEAAIHQQIGSLIASCPKGDDLLDEDIGQTEAAIEALDTSIHNILVAIESGHSEEKHSRTLLDRLSELEAERDALHSQLQELYGKQAAFSSEIIVKRASALLSLVQSVEDFEKTGFNGIRTEVNAMMREIFKQVVVDYDAGELVFEWAHGGESAVIYAMPPI